MPSVGDEIEQERSDRVKTFQGQTFTCWVCKEDGTVGDDLDAATTVTDPGGHRSFWWIHENCKDEYQQKKGSV